MSEKPSEAGGRLTVTVGTEADGRSGQAVDIVTRSTGLYIHNSCPVIAVIIEASTSRDGDNAITRLRETAIQPDGGMGTTVVLLDTEGWHSIPSHPREAIPLSCHMPVAQRDTRRVVDVVISVSPWFIQTDIRRAGI